MSGMNAIFIRKKMVPKLRLNRKFHISLSLFQTLDKRDFEEDLWGKECEYFDCWRPVRLGLRAIERSLWEKKMMVGSMQKRGSCIPPMI